MIGYSVKKELISVLRFLALPDLPSKVILRIFTATVSRFNNKICIKLSVRICRNEPSEHSMKGIWVIHNDSHVVTVKSNLGSLIASEYLKAVIRSNSRPDHVRCATSRENLGAPTRTKNVLLKTTRSLFPDAFLCKFLSKLCSSPFSPLLVPGLNTTSHNDYILRSQHG